MDQVATILGIDLPATGARKAIMKGPVDCRNTSKSPILTHRDSLLLLEKTDTTTRKHDDDTASTCTATAWDSDSSIVSASATVTFAEPVVTEVHTRPYTTLREKYALYYNEYDYTEFRREAYGLGRREKVVQFTDSIVSSVWTIPPVEDVSSLYYSQSELQSFLDEFIASLDGSF